MTIEEELRKGLTENGMSEKQANRVIQKVKSLKANDTMAERWQHDIEDYPPPPPFLTVLWLSVRQVALEDIDATCPQAWFRPLFTGEKIEP